MRGSSGARSTGERTNYEADHEADTSAGRTEQHAERRSGARARNATSSGPQTGGGEHRGSVRALARSKPWAI